MPKLLGTLLVAGALSLVVTFLLDTFVNEPAETLLYSDEGIEKVDVEFGKGTILLNVYLSRPLTCNQVIKKLGIETLPLKNKIYSPVCSSINESNIKIVYSELTKV